MKKEHLVKKTLPDPSLNDMILQQVDTSQLDIDLRKKAINLVDDMHKKAGCHALVVVGRHTEALKQPFSYVVTNTGMKANTTDLALNVNLTFLFCSCDNWVCSVGGNKS